MGESRLGCRSVNISQGKAAITMKLLGFLLLLPLVISSPIQDEKVETSIDEKQLMIELVENLFNSDRDSRELEVELEEGEDEAAGEDLGENVVEEDEKSLSSLVKEENPAEIERFNAYQDAILRRINAALKAKLMDPMVLNLNGKKSKKNKKERNAKGLKKKKRNGKSLTEEDEEEEDEEVEEVEEAGEERALKKKEKKKGGMKGKGGNKKKRNNNKAKKLSAEEKKAKAEEKKARAAERKSKHKERKNKKHGGKHNKRGNKGNKGGNKKKKQEQEQEEMLARSRRNKHSRSDKKGKKEKEDFTEGKTLATLSGIATLRRSGDVEVMNAESHKIVKSKFSVGPLQLEVKKTVGKGKERSIKTAKAITEKLTGKIVIKVKPDGTSHVRSVVFMKPEEVDVRGTLGDKKRSDLYLKRSIGQVRPMAAQRVLKMARYVMKSPSTVERS